MKTGKIHFAVEFDENTTDLESVTTALERLLETALATPGILDEYGSVDVGEMLCEEIDSVLI